MILAPEQTWLSTEEEVLILSEIKSNPNAGKQAIAASLGWEEIKTFEVIKQFVADGFIQYEGDVGFLLTRSGENLLEASIKRINEDGFAPKGDLMRSGEAQHQERLLDRRHISELFPHPINTEIYGKNEDSSKLKETIRRLKKIKTLTISSLSEAVVNGCTCLAIAKELFEEDPDEFRCFEFPQTERVDFECEQDEIEYLIGMNEGREKTEEQKLKELEFLEPILKVKAKKNIITGGKKKDVPDKIVVEQELAKKLGKSRATLAKGKAVLGAIRDLELAGETNAVELLRHELNGKRNYSAAAKLANKFAEERASQQECQKSCHTCLHKVPLREEEIEHSVLPDGTTLEDARCGSRNITLSLGRADFGKEDNCQRWKSAEGVAPVSPNIAKLEKAIAKTRILATFEGKAEGLVSEAEGVEKFKELAAIAGYCQEIESLADKMAIALKKLGTACDGIYSETSASSPNLRAMLLAVEEITERGKIALSSDGDRMQVKLL